MGVSTGFGPVTDCGIEYPPSASFRANPAARVGPDQPIRRMLPAMAAARFHCTTIRPVMPKALCMKWVQRSL